MLVMFAAGSANLALMLGLAAVMAGERVAPPLLARRLGHGVGALLLGLAALVALSAFV